MFKVTILLMAMMFSCNSPNPTPVPSVRPYRLVTLTIQPSSTQGVSYRIYRNVNSAAYSLLAQNLQVLTYQDTALARKKTYCYTATAMLNGLESTATMPWCVTTI